MSELATISQITLPSGDTYDIKDSKARNDIEVINTTINGIVGGGTFVVAWTGNAAPVAGNIPAGVVVTYQSTDTTGTLVAGVGTLSKFYLVRSSTQQNPTLSDIYDEYITVNNGTDANPSYAWEKIGDTQIKLSEVVTNVTLEQQTATVLGSSTSVSVTQPTFTVTPASTYLKTSTNSTSFLKSVTPTEKKLTTTSITIANGSSTSSNNNSDWLKNISVLNGVLSIGAATLSTSNTTLATGALSSADTVTNVGGTIISAIDATDTSSAVTGVTLTDTTSADGEVEVAKVQSVNATAGTAVGVTLGSNDTKTVLTSATSISVTHPN